MASDLAWTRHGNLFTFRWDSELVMLECTVHEQKHDVIAEVSARNTATQSLVLQRRVNLWNGRANLTRELAHWARLDQRDVQFMVETAATIILGQLRTDNPTVNLFSVRTLPPLPPPIEYLCYPGQVSAIYADGGTGKSTLAHGLAVYATLGRSFPSFTISQPTHVLYLDYEDSADNALTVTRAILRGLGEPSDPPIYYRAMSHPILDDIEYLRRDCSMYQIGLVIVDSLAPACGLEPETSDAVLRTMLALRQLGDKVAVLVLAHVTKVAAETKASEPIKPYGSVFVWNSCRTLWEMRSIANEDDDIMAVALFNRKRNYGRLRPAIGIAVDHGHDMITFRRTDLTDYEAAISRLGVGTQILAALRPGRMSTTELAQDLGKPTETIRRVCRRLEGVGKIRELGTTKSERGRPEILWGLAAQADA